MVCPECFCCRLLMAIEQESSYPPSCCAQTIHLDKLRTWDPGGYYQKIQRNGKRTFRDWPYLLFFNLRAVLSSFLIPRYEVSSLVVMHAERMHHLQESPTPRGELPLGQGSNAVFEIARKNGWKSCHRCGVWLSGMMATITLCISFIRNTFQVQT